MVEMDHLLGIRGSAATVVGGDNTAVTMGSGSLPIFATPAMAVLAEQAAVHALQSYLPLGTTTVGMGLSLKHLAASPVGHNVSAEAVVVGVEGRRLEFKVVVYDEREKIGEGTHERFVIEAESFMNKLMLKKPKV
ncbi:MAG: thioesterase family protein [Candidatus Sericytochromatia bacterium]|nr:thioesterase family protein [Candidatus Sericytochromatia bacterium]